MKEIEERQRDFSETTSIKKEAEILTAAIREPLLVLDHQYNAVSANDSFLNTFSFSREDVVGKRIFSLNQSKWDIKALHELLEVLSHKEQVENFQIGFKAENFGRYSCTVNAGYFRRSSGASLILLTFKPETHHLNLKQQDLNYLKMVRDIFVNAPAMMCRLSGPDHIFELANERYYELIGRKDIIGKSIGEVIPEIASQGFIHVLDEVFNTEKPYSGHEIPVDLHLPDNRIKKSFLNFVLQPLWNETGMISGIFVHAVDVTELVTARKKVEQSELELRNTIDTVPVMIWITDENGNCTYLNKYWYDYTGQSASEAEGFGWTDVVHPEEREQAHERFSEACAEQWSYDVSYRLRTASGEYRWVIDRGSPRFTSDGNFIGMLGSVIDVHEEVLKGQLIRESEHRIRNIVEEATVATAIYTGPEMTIEMANKAMIKLWGKDPSVVGTTLREALPELQGQPTLGLLEKVYTTGEIYWGKEDRVDLVIDGELQEGYFNYTYKPLRDKSGKIYGILNMALDVTEQVLTRKRIQESEQHYQDIIHSSPSLIATFEGRDMHIKVANDAILEAWGRGKEVIGKPLFTAIPELADQGFKEILDEVYETGKPYRAFEKSVKLYRNGRFELGYFNFTYHPQRDINGEIIGIVDIATEVTPQAEINRKIKESESYFRQMADLMPEKVINTDPLGNAIYFNQNWLDYTGLTSDELKWQDWTNWIHEKDKPGFQREWRSSLESGKDFEMEIRLKNRDGKHIWHLNRGEAVRDQNGDIKMWISTNTEIQRLKEEEKRKEEFLKMVSHELKTPVTSMKGYVQLLLKLLGTGNEKKVGPLPLQPSLERIDHQITRLTRLISEMLDLSRIEENRMELQKEQFKVNELVDETVQDINYTNTRHHLRVHHECECTVEADKDRIGQVLINLITNAIKYSPESQEVNIFIQQGRKDQVWVRVRDEGIGIGKEDQEKIFKRFYRINEEEEDTYSGFGIGLYLANEIIERHNGVLQVRSERGVGSEFSFSLTTIENNKKPE